MRTMAAHFASRFTWYCLHILCRVRIFGWFRNNKRSCAFNCILVIIRRLTNLHSAGIRQDFVVVPIDT